ncbi:hypothetical protein B0H11DRAFT_1952810 [Mycena galericulata]|nr:hypothetical protein B0H11DRAFT_1952810 [Mycena galericulata]
MLLILLLTATLTSRRLSTSTAHPPSGSNLPSPTALIALGLYSSSPACFFFWLALFLSFLSTPNVLTFYCARSLFSFIDPIFEFRICLHFCNRSTSISKTIQSLVSVRVRAVEKAGNNGLKSNDQEYSAGDSKLTIGSQRQVRGLSKSCDRRKNQQRKERRPRRDGLGFSALINFGRPRSESSSEGGGLRAAAE